MRLNILIFLIFFCQCCVIETTSTHIVALCGSITKISTNLGLLRAVAKILPASYTIDIIVPSDLPLFSQDLENDADYPESVKHFRDRLKRADFFLFAVSEHNYSISSSLKNAIDWGSRGQDGGNLFNDKVAGIISAGGAEGGLRAQNHLRDIGVFLNLHFLNKPSVLVRLFEQPSPVDWATGDLIDAKVHVKLTEFLDALIAFYTKHQ